MMHLTRDHDPPEDHTYYSSNLAEGKACFRHGAPKSAVGPVFRCEFCGENFCPVCTTGVWHDGAVGGQPYVWYRCPSCPIGLAFVAVPPAESAPCRPAIRADGWYVRVVTDPVLQQTRPGAYRVLFPTVNRHGFYRAVRDGEQCLLQLDGSNWWSWVQLADCVQLAAVPAVADGALATLEEGEYILAQPPRPFDCPRGQVPAPKALFLMELPQGYQEYEMPEGWPEDGAMRLLRVTDHVWRPEELMQALPALAEATT